MCVFREILQTMFSAAVMSGSSNGVQAIVKQTYEHAAYVHCYAHQLNLVMLNAASENTNVHIFFANLQGMLVSLKVSLFYYKYSCAKIDVFLENIHR